MWNHQELGLHCWWRSWLIFLMHFGYIWLSLHLLHNNEGSKAATFPLTHPLLSISASACVVCVWRLCVCDMDRLGRNEFIGEVRVALKKLKEGESKRYNMGLERIAQVHICCVCMCDSVAADRSHKYQMGFCGHIYQDMSYFHCACLPLGDQVPISNVV